MPDVFTPPAFSAAPTVPADIDVVGVPVFADLTVPDGAGITVDGGYLGRRGFEGRPGQAVALPGEGETTVLALGVGPAGSVGPDELRQAAAVLARQAGAARRAATTLLAAAGGAEQAAAIVEGAGLGSYRFVGERRPPTHPGLAEVVVVGATEEAVNRGALTVAATCAARTWVNTPPRQLTPRRLAEEAVAHAEGSGATVEVWDEDRIAAERLGGICAVASGAAEPPRVIRLEWAPPGATATVALVGKGITFDSGGLSLKPPASMMTMKSDMGGGAAVIAAVVALAREGVPIQVVGWVPATENMPGGRAIHPGDTFVARNGKSVEVLNTDAEGRLVLADALSLAVEEEPDAVVDVATLTGAQRTALGDSVAAVMGTSPDLVAEVIAAGGRAGEPTWELPLFPNYRKQLDSEVADLRNIATGTGAGSIMAGLFLKEFTDGRPWAHLDIAGPSWTESNEGILSKGGTGWGARTLIELVRAWPAGSDAQPARR